MIVLVLTAIGVGSALLSLDRVKRLAQIDLRRLWLVWVALVAQVLLFEYLGPHISRDLGNAMHLGTYALCLAFLWFNRQIPFMWLIAVGASCNLAAIAANGGTMPADPDAWAAAGLPEFSPEVFENSRALSSPRLLVLGDIFHIPASWPLSNVFSIGDVLIVVGGTALAHAWCRHRPVPTERLELSLPRT